MHDIKRLYSLDLLRAIAAFLVAISHFCIFNGKIPLFENISVAAVEIFFVLSGYVLASQLLLVLSGTNNTLRIFLIRRWMRTIPAYFLALLLVSVIFKKIGSNDFYRYLFYIQNLFQQYNHVDYYSVAWSLSVEEWFYIVFPIFMLTCVKLIKKRHINAYIFYTCVFITAITILRLSVTLATSFWGESVRRVVVFRIDSIAYGFLLFLMINKFAYKPSLVFGLLGLLIFSTAILYLLHIIDKTLPQVLYPFTAASFGCFAIIFFLSFEDTRMYRNMMVRQVSHIAGQISYAVYLFHMPVMYMVGLTLGTYPFLVRLIVFLVGILTIAAVSNYLFEQPILLLRPKYQPLSQNLAQFLHDQNQPQSDYS
jgi:peptidoglycan/LPS O-acetylase OafA/YrhL